MWGASPICGRAPNCPPIAPVAHASHAAQDSFLHVVVFAGRGSAMRSYLVVANQTLGGEHLIARVRECLAAGPCRFHVLVPATPPSDHAWTEAEARALAQARLDSSLARFHKLGADVQGAVGDKDPMLAIEDILRTERFDEIILSTLPPGISKWLKKDLPRRVADRFGLPLTHLIGTPEPVLTRDEPDA